MSIQFTFYFWPEICHKSVFFPGDFQGIALVINCFKNGVHNCDGLPCGRDELVGWIHPGSLSFSVGLGNALELSSNSQEECVIVL